MKKKTVLLTIGMIIVLFGLNNLNAQISNFPYTQNFESGLSIPIGWTNDSGNSGEDWIYVTGAIGNGATADHTDGWGNYAGIDDDSPHTVETGLITPEFNFSFLSAVSLSFWYWIGDGPQQATLLIDSYDGTGWTSGVASLTTTGVAEWTKYEIEISKTIENIRFRALETAGNQSDICIDDVVLEDRDPEFNVSPDIFVFEDTYVGTSSFTQSFTVTNTGWGDLTINPAVSITGTNANQFILNDGNSYPIILGEGQNLGQGDF